MNTKEIKKLKCGKVTFDINLKNYTTYKLNSKASCLVIPGNLKELKSILEYVKVTNSKYKIIGGGSNLIFEDDYYDGILIKLDEFNDLEIKGPRVRVGSGYNTIKLAMKVSKLGLTGMEFATGIPGTIGGAIFNNSGAYKSDMGYIVEYVTVLTPDLELKKIYNKDLDFHYRTSFFKKNPGYVIIEANIILRRGTVSSIMEVIEDRKVRRMEAQPLEYPSAGSVFRNPENNYAGKLIEDLGYKGKNYGGAEISTKHANFIINKGNAKGSDIVNLINDIKKDVKEKNNIDLVLEQEIVK